MPSDAVFMIVLMALIGLAIATATVLERRRSRQIHRSLLERLRRMRRVGDRARRD